MQNALDFLSKAISELDDHPKYSVIHFYAALELFLKARLMDEHWTLVVANQKDLDLDKFMSGDFRSVSLKEARIRLGKVVQSGLSDQVFDAFDEVRRHRNKMVHFFHEAHSKKGGDALKQEIVKQQLNAWYFLNRLLTVQWKDVFRHWSGRIAKIDTELRQLHGFLQVVFDNLAPEIAKLKGQEIQFGKCPSCGFESQSQEQEPEIESVYEAECLVCELSQWCLPIFCPECNEMVVFVDEGFATCDSCGKSLEPNDLANILHDPRAALAARSKGDDSWDLRDCIFCDGCDTVVRVPYVGYFCTSCWEACEAEME